MTYRHKTESHRYNLSSSVRGLDEGRQGLWMVKKAPNMGWSVHLFVNTFVELQPYATHKRYYGEEDSENPCPQGERPLNRPGHSDIHAKLSLYPGSQKSTWAGLEEQKTSRRKWWIIWEFEERGWGRETVHGSSHLCRGAGQNSGAANNWVVSLSEVMHAF